MRDSALASYSGSMICTKRIIKQNTKFTGRSLGWRALLVAAKMSADEQDFEKAEQLASKSLSAAQRYLGEMDLELTPILVLLATIYEHLNRPEDKEKALAKLRLALRTIEPES